MSAPHSIEIEQFTCVDCDAAYTIGEEERRFYSDRADLFPQRCLDCRAKARALRNDDLIRNLETQYSRGDWQEHLGHFGGGAPGQRNERRRRTGHAAVCSACGAETLVPFIPRRGKPVYCAPCFSARERAKKTSS